MFSSAKKPPLVIVPWKLILAHRHLLRQTVRRDVAARYAGAVFGLAWMVLYPLLFLGMYAAIYLYVFQIRVPEFGSLSYVALIFCGLVPFLGVAEVLQSGISAVTGNRSLIKNTLYPIQLIPVKTVLVSQCTQAIGMVLLLIVIAAMGRLGSWALLLPLVWAAQLMFMAGLVWILSALAVYFKDLENIIGVLILMLMMISPIAYTVDMVPPNLAKFLALNPLYYMIISYQSILIQNRFPPGNIFWIYLVFSVIFFYIGYWFFNVIKKALIDNL